MKLELYMFDTCPFCKRVLKVIDELGRNDIEIKNIFQDGNGEKLIEIGGKDQVPCLVIDGSPMYESGDIIKYLRNQQ